MKKISSLLAAILIFAASSFANTDPEPSNKKIAVAFAKQFTAAESVSWSQVAMIATANFMIDGEYLSAHFSPDAKMLGISKNVAAKDLPINLQLDLKSYLDKSWITSIFEYATPDADTFYVTIENADAKIMLKSEGGQFEVYKKTDKKEL